MDHTQQIIKEYIQYEYYKMQLRMLLGDDNDFDRIYTACRKKSEATTYSLTNLLNIYVMDVMKYGEPNLSMFIFDERG